MTELATDDTINQIAADKQLVCVPMYTRPEQSAVAGIEDR